MNGIEEIRQRVYELAESIASHPSAMRYFSILEQMKEDKHAQEVLSRLVEHGKKLSDGIDGGDADIAHHPDSAELRQALTEKPMVMEFVAAQNEYLQLVKEIMDILHTRLNP